MSNRLADKTAVVTGGTSNIGRAIAISLAAERAGVVVSGRNSNSRLPPPSTRGAMIDDPADPGSCL